MYSVFTKKNKQNKTKQTHLKCDAMLKRNTARLFLQRNRNNFSLANTWNLKWIQIQIKQGTYRVCSWSYCDYFELYLHYPNWQKIFNWGWYNSDLHLLKIIFRCICQSCLEQMKNTSEENIWWLLQQASGEYRQHKNTDDTLRYGEDIVNSRNIWTNMTQ